MGQRTLGCPHTLRGCARRHPSRGGAGDVRGNRVSWTVSDHGSRSGTYRSSNQCYGRDTTTEIYTLIWKLMLHPTTEGKDRKNLAPSTSSTGSTVTGSTGTGTGMVGKKKSVLLWSDREYFGSAARDAAIEQN
mmetsp:Transcript_1798/g.1945  ORF Transcript_1798/g.1945 Transcript_1798/m.1945 type:complete len:133 (+) Transcript_1798:380-778(+)